MFLPQTPLAGNPLAIFTDARGLTDKQMQGPAHEMNLSETTFILLREPDVEKKLIRRCTVTHESKQVLAFIAARVELVIVACQGSNTSDPLRTLPDVLRTNSKAQKISQNLR